MGTVEESTGSCFLKNIVILFDNISSQSDNLECIWNEERWPFNGLVYTFMDEKAYIGRVRISDSLTTIEVCRVLIGLGAVGGGLQIIPTLGVRSRGTYAKTMKITLT